MLREITLTVNGQPRSFTADDTTTLLDTLRNHLDLKGARYGCGAEQCGACSVIIDGEDKPSCAIEVGTLEGRAIVTVEGMGTPGRPHPLQQAFIDKQAGQCGYCLSGILVGAKALLDRNPSPTRAEVADALAWHLCRCAAHNRIMDAVLLAAERMREGVSA
ncbi:MAG TPA: (2Fe-2S)-binding protein [Caulobacteraceae bacterium]|nr:(2Fe-2S)-binding protein [Caulobacteraceae bacterium]